MKKWKQKYQTGMALLICSTFLIGAIEPASAYAKEKETAVISIDTSDFTYDKDSEYYSVDEQLDTITGSISTSSKIKEISYEIADAQGIVIKEGVLDTLKNWTVSDVALALGKNTLTITVETQKDTESKEIEIYNQSLENTEQMDVDQEDDDNDGLINYWEEYFGTDKDNTDTDGDGVSDYDEIIVLGTDPLVKDTSDNGVTDGQVDADNDGLTNEEELALGTDPFTADTDEDGLSDYEEVNRYHTDPLVADSDSDGANDGWEVQNGFDPLVKNKKFSVTSTSEDGNASISSKKLVGSDAEAFGVEVASEDTYNLTSIPGAASDVYVLGANVKAELSIAYEKQSDEDNPAIYLYDTQKQKLIYLKSTYEDGYVTANSKDQKEGFYIVLNKTVYDPYKKSGNVSSTSTKDSNNDGISDVDTKMICDGTLLTATLEKVFGDATYEQVQENADFDGDGVINGDEISILTDDEGNRYVYVTSSPILTDSDSDGIDDSKDTAPLERGLKDGIIGAVQIYSRHDDDEGFFLGHAFIVFTSYVDGEEITISNINTAYDYDQTQDTYVARESDKDTIALSRGEYVSIGNYRSAGLDAVYDSVVKNDYELAWEDSGLSDYISFDEISMESLLEFAISGNSSVAVNEFEQSMNGESIRFNEEIYDTYAYEDFTQYPNAVLTKEITEEQLQALVAYDESHNYYGLFNNNCSSLATGSWNSAFDDELYAREDEGIYSLFDSPMILKAHILALDGAEQDLATFGVSVS